MQVDEHDIFQVKLGQKIAITFDAYKNQIFEAEVSKIASIMNERNKTFLIEAHFTKAPEKLYPNVTFEANIILKTKNNALILPRNYLKNDSIVTLIDGSTRVVKLGLTDFQKAEILSGLSAKDQVVKPN
jgi:multidrug efflux pump subunit AcrA (membrane-fusion protein)